MCVRARVRWTVLFIHPHESPRRHKGMRTPTPPPSLYTRLLNRGRKREGEGEGERKRGVATPGSDPSQLLPIIRVLGFTPTGSTTCSTDSAYAFVLDRKRSQASVSSRYPPFFQISLTFRQQVAKDVRLARPSRYRSLDPANFLLSSSFLSLSFGWRMFSLLSFSFFPASQEFVRDGWIGIVWKRKEKNEVLYEEGGMIHGLIRIKRGLIGSLAVWWSALSLENVRVSISGMIMLQERRPRHSWPATSKCHSWYVLSRETI